MFKSSARYLVIGAVFGVLFGAVAAAGSAAAGPLGEAQSLLDTAVGPKSKLGFEPRLEVSVGMVVAAALALVGTVFLLLTIYAGILWMTASGKEDQIEKAHKIITACVIGLFITMAAYAITAFVTGRLAGVGGGAPGGDATGQIAAQGGLTDAECQAKGGLCDFVASVGEGCDPKGIDQYDGSSPGACTVDNEKGNLNQNPRICCTLKNNDDKCRLLGGACQKDSCKAPALLDAGIKCEEGHTPDWYCCRPR